MKIYHVSHQWKCQLLGHVQLFATPWTIAHQAPLSMGFSRARILEWVAISFSRGGPQPQPRYHVLVSCTASRFFTIWATREAPNRKGLSLYTILIYLPVLTWKSNSWKDWRHIVSSRQGLPSLPFQKLPMSYRPQALSPGRSDRQKTPPW